MSATKMLYKATHSALRACTRYGHFGERAAKLKEACDERKHWFGDARSRPAPLAHQVALRVLNGSMRDDPLLCNRIVRDVKPEDRKLVAQVVLNALRAQR